MSLNGTVAMAVLFGAGIAGAYRYGNRGPELALSTIEQSTLLRNEFVFRFLSAPQSADAPKAKLDEQGKKIEAHRKKAIEYANELLKRHRCYGCILSLSPDTALYRLELPQLGYSATPTK